MKEILPDGAVFQFDYVVAGNTIAETRVTDPNGNLTTHRFNGQGVEAKTLDALGRQTVKQIDYTTNLLTAETDPALRTTRYTYDSHGNRTSIVDAEGNTTLIEYDQKWNKPVKITDALGTVTTMEYDPRGNLTRLTNGAGESTTFSYTAAGQLKTATDPLGHTTTLGYDSEGNLASVTDPLGNVSQSRYDAANRLSEAINPRGRSTQYSYDTLDRLTQVLDALGGKTQLGYDGQGNLLTVVDANNHPIETNAYDLRNRLTQKTDARNKSETYQYDSNGNLTAKTDRKGQTTTYQYDPLNRLTRITDAGGRTTTYGYDLAGNLSRISDTDSGDILLDYDRLNRLTQVATGQGTVSYAYDPLGRRTERRINGTDPTTYAYDRAGRLSAIAYRGKTVAYTYDQAGRLSGKTLPNGLLATYQYDAANRLTVLAYTKPDATPVETLSYTYDENGNRTTRSTLAAQSLPDTPFIAAYDAANRMTSYNGYPLAYDDNGNLTQRQTAQGPVNYTWDARNRLSRIDGPNGSAAFKYDPLGRRLEKTVNGRTTQYLYDGAQAIAELQGSAIGTTYLTGLAIDEILARYSNGAERSQLTDALGSIIAQAKEDRSIQNHYAYSTWGETLAAGTDEDNPSQYTARENDQTGLYYYRARYYDPQLKRFVSEDPIGLEGGLNLYAYVTGNPLRYTDPDGLCPRGYKGADGIPGACVPDDRVEPSSCVTAECSAGLPPAPQDNRTPEQIDRDSCEFVCGLVSPGPPIPLSKKGAAQWTASGFACKWICKDPKRRKCLSGQ